MRWTLRRKGNALLGSHLPMRRPSCEMKPGMTHPSHRPRSRSRFGTEEWQAAPAGSPAKFALRSSCGVPPPCFPGAPIDAPMTQHAEAESKVPRIHCAASTVTSQPGTGLVLQGWYYTAVTGSRSAGSRFPRRARQPVHDSAPEHGVFPPLFFPLRADDGLDLRRAGRRHDEDASKSPTM